jgi:protein O-mannosyl-transferase
MGQFNQQEAASSIPAKPGLHGNSLPVAGVCFGLALLVGVIYAGTAEFAFVNRDDDEYVYANPHVATGLTADNLAWAFRSSHAANWHPLTFLSHMLDVELFGLQAGRHHLTNVVFHAATAIALFLAWRRLTGNLGRSAVIAALFAAHPLRVESVAWVSERKDVLSGLFFALTLLAYAGYARRPSLGRFGLVSLPFGLGLLAKPMLVTTPFVLLLLDYWPLGRWSATSREGRWRLLAEKAPWLGMAVAAALVTLWAQREAIQTTETMTLWTRLANALVSYVVYMRQLIWPFDLACFYPQPKNGLSAWMVVGAFAVLMALTFGAYDRRERQPYLLFGWLWYLGMLVPVIGIVQVGVQAHADRYTYLPQIGLLAALVWWAAEEASAWKFRTSVLGAATICLLAALAWRAHDQAQHWRNTEELFAQAIRSTSDNALAHNALGCALRERGADVEAAAQFEQAAAISPQYALALCNHGFILIKLGQFERAEASLRKAAELEPSNAMIWAARGEALRSLHRLDEAAACLQEAMALAPNAERANALGAVQAEQGHFQDAVSNFRLSLRLDPGDRRACANLARALHEVGQSAESLRYLRQALELEPNHAQLLRLAAWVAATSPGAGALPNEAIAWASKATELEAKPDLTSLDVLAAAYADAGRFEEAAGILTKALDLPSARANPARADRLRAHLDLYLAGRPARGERLGAD